MTKILAGIVLYNPNIKRLQDNVAAIAPQVECLVFIDNASKNMDEVKEALPANSVVIHNDKEPFANDGGEYTKPVKDKRQENYELSDFGNLEKRLCDESYYRLKGLN